MSLSHKLTNLTLTDSFDYFAGMFLASGDVDGSLFVWRLVIDEKPDPESMEKAMEVEEDVQVIEETEAKSWARNI